MYMCVVVPACVCLCVCLECVICKDRRLAHVNSPAAVLGMVQVISMISESCGTFGLIILDPNKVHTHAEH